MSISKAQSPIGGGVCLHETKAKPDLEVRAMFAKTQAPDALAARAAAVGLPRLGTLAGQLPVLSSGHAGFAKKLLKPSILANKG